MTFRAGFQELKKVLANLLEWLFLWIIKMLIYERVDDLEGNAFDKTDKSKECMTWHYWYFKDKNFNFEKLICNDCQLKEEDVVTICH